MSRAEIALKHFNEQREFMNVHVNSGIELNRKGFKRIEFKNKEGEPVKGLSFKAVQKNHYFNFGCNMFLLDEFDTEEKNKKYRELFPKIFNYAVVPFYWNAVEPEQGKKRFDADSPKFYRRPPTDLITNFCLENNIRMKGHCLVYDHFNPEWMPQDALSYKRLIRSHFEDIANRYGKIISDWDIVNEALTWKCYDTKYVSEFFRDEDYVTYPFEVAKSLPFERKFINDSDGIWENFHFTRTYYYLFLRDLERRNVDFNAIGLQYHQFVPKEKEEEYALDRYNPMKMFDVLDTFGKFGKPIQLSEITVSAYSDSDEDTAIQAELLKNMYKIWFSHKNVDAIVYWNLVDGLTSGGKPNEMNAGENKYHGALLNFDLSPKPAFKVLDELINHEWHTEGIFTSNDYGFATLNGFKGDYELGISYNGKNYTKNIKLDDRYDVTVHVTLD